MSNGMPSNQNVFVFVLKMYATHKHVMFKVES